MEQVGIEQWEQIGSDTIIEMTEFIKPYVTPISRALSQDEGEHLGSGSYFELENKKYIITNEHVAKYLNMNSLTHQFWGNENIFRLINPLIAVPYPTDVAISKIEEKIWSFCEHKALAIPSNIFEQKHNPLQGEFLFWSGYSGERAKFIFGHMVSRGTPYLTQECNFPNDFDDANPKFHFLLHYRPDLEKSIVGNSHLPNPHGFSGSLVWNTKRLECIHTGKKWSPELAKITGIVWGWSSSHACILATKVEHLKLRKIANVEIINS